VDLGLTTDLGQLECRQLGLHFDRKTACPVNLLDSLQKQMK